MKILEVVLFLAVTLPQINRISGTVPVRCQDESWALFEGKCYKAFGPAVSLGGERNHLAARDFCVSLDGYLVSINSETEQSFVNKLMPSGISYWIGLFSIETVQTQTAGWQWADGTVFSYTHWGFNEPNSNSERCVETISTPNVWNDHFCTYEKSFVCEVVAEPVTCSDISFPDPNGMITDCQNSNEPPAGTVCRYVCYPEYVLEGDETRTCQEDGSWSGTDDHSCKVVTCQALVFDDPNGQITGCDNEMDAQIDTVCNFECDSGYTLEGQTSRRCEENGLWSGQAEQFCKVVTCSELSFEGTIECIPENSIEFDTACVFSCPLGKAKISGDVIRFCQADGQWSGIMPVCGALMCSLLTFPAGSVVCNPSDSIVYGTVCSFECPSGYEPDLPGLTMTCEADQDWSGSMPTSCQPVDCGSYPDVLNGQSMCDGTTYQKTCFAICNLGYKVKNAQSQCMADGQWGVPALECSRIICSDLDFNNQPGKMTCNPPGFGYPSTCSFICFDGYELKGSETLTCQKDAMWDDIEPTCLDVYCPALSLEGGIVDCSDEWEYSSECTFKCNFPLTLYGEDEITCRANGRWSSPVPECKLFDPKCDDAMAPIICVDNCETNSDCEESEVCCKSPCGLTCKKIKDDPKKPLLNLNKRTVLALLLAGANRQPRPVYRPVCPSCYVNACIRTSCPTFLNAVCRTSCNGCKKHFFNPSNLRQDIASQCDCPPNSPPNPRCGGYMCNGVGCANFPQAECRVYGCGPICYLQFFDRFGRRVPCKRQATCQPGINLIDRCSRGCLGTTCPKYPGAHCRVPCPGCPAHFYNQKTNQPILDCV